MNPLCFVTWLHIFYPVLLIKSISNPVSVGSFSIISADVGLGLPGCFFQFHFSSSICLYFSHFASIQLVDMSIKLYNINQQNAPFLN